MLTRTKAASAKRGPDRWSLTLLDRATGLTRTIAAKVVVNAAGPWAGEVLNTTLRVDTHAKVRLVQGSHIVVRKLYDHDRCYIFQNADNRILFAIPYEQDFTLIGTTDRDYEGDPADVHTSSEEIDYIVGSANDYFARTVAKDDIVWTYSGVRPL